MGFGVCIIALGYELYGTYALNLALSLKVYDQDCKIALLYSPEAIQHLTAEEKKFFDHFVPIPEGEYTTEGKKDYMGAKLLVNKYTPFTHTIYLDADNIWLDKKVSWLFGEMYGKQFFIGMNAHWDVKKGNTNKHGYTYWCRDEREVIKHHNIQNILPQTVSGFFYFEKGVYADYVFKLAKEVHSDKAAPFSTFAGGMPDEYAFNVALGLLEHKQKEYNPVYFDKIHGALEGHEIYSNYWAIAVGGNRVTQRVKELYNRLVDKYTTMAGLSEKRYFQEKYKVIPERFKN